MTQQLTVSPEKAVTVVLTTVAMYVGFIVLVRVFGQRSLASMSSFDIGCVVALGAVLGRTVLLKDPTLAVGLIALATLFTTQATLDLLRRLEVMDRALNRPPALLVYEGVLVQRNLTAFRVLEAEVRQALRRAGVHSLEEVGCLVLERNGTLSVIDRSRSVDAWLLQDVIGASGGRTGRS